ncbi:hypothetical protein T03_14524 [Trichinella britovi]|nr:hypothetical protein T03_14524 [Trichinella britovi]
MLMLYLIVDMCINNAYLLMSQQQSYKKTKKHFMKELSAQNIETRYQMKKSMDKQKMPSSATDCSQNQEDEKIHRNAKIQNVEDQRETAAIHSTASLLGIAAASVTDVQLSPHCCSFICARHAIITAASSFDVQDRECMCRIKMKKVTKSEHHALNSSATCLRRMMTLSRNQLGLKFLSEPSGGKQYSMVSVLG